MSVRRHSGWLVAAVVVALIAYVSLNTLRSEGVGSEGLKAGTKEIGRAHV